MFFAGKRLSLAKGSLKVIKIPNWYTKLVCKVKFVSFTMAKMSAKMYFEAAFNPLLYVFLTIDVLCFFVRVASNVTTAVFYFDGLISFPPAIPRAFICLSLTSLSD